MTDKSLLQAVADRGTQSSEKDALQRFDWLLKALELFIDEGIDAVRITRLADALEVTRGSFYWHFRNREDLIQALVSYWRDKNTAAIVNVVSAANDLPTGILGFFEACVDNDRFDSRLDLAIREWSRRDADIRKELDREDQLRLEAFTELFKRCGFAMPEALIRARVIYFSQIGFYALDVQESLSTRLGYTEAWYKVFTGVTLDELAAERFKQRVLSNTKKRGYQDHG